MGLPASESPVDEYERRLAERCRTAKCGIAAMAAASVALQCCTAGLLLWSLHTQKQYAVDAAVVAAWPAAACGIVALLLALLNWPILPWRWRFLGLLPWAMFVAGVVVVAIFLAAVMGFL